MTVEERLAKVEQKLHDLKLYIMGDMKIDVKELETKFEEKVAAMEEMFEEKVATMDERCHSQFKWTIVIYLMTFSTVVALILGLCVRG